MVNNKFLLRQVIESECIFVLTVKKTETVLNKCGKMMVVALVISAQFKVNYYLASSLSFSSSSSSDPLSRVSFAFLG